MSNETTASTICADLHNVLYRLDLQSADSWQMRVDMAKVILSHHGVKFKTKFKDMPEGMDCETFVFSNCEVFSFNSVQFEYFITNHLDFASWQETKGKIAVFGEVLIQALSEYHATEVAIF